MRTNERKTKGRRSKRCNVLDGFPTTDTLSHKQKNKEYRKFDTLDCFTGDIKQNHRRNC